MSDKTGGPAFPCAEDSSHNTKKLALYHSKLGKVREGLKRISDIYHFRFSGYADMMNAKADEMLQSLDEILKGDK